jgi:uncharacterized protein YfeS
MAIDRDQAHPRARELAPDPFFWDDSDELAPFGSDEGDTALAEFRRWRKKNRASSVEYCIIWVLNSVGDMNSIDYKDQIAEPETVRRQIQDDPGFDNRHYIYTLDVSVIATGFGQLVDEGKIDGDCKPYIRRALRRQIVWAELEEDWQHGAQYVRNLKRLEEILDRA